MIEFLSTEQQEMYVDAQLEYNKTSFWIKWCIYNQELYLARKLIYDTIAVGLEKVSAEDSIAAWGEYSTSWACCLPEYPKRKLDKFNPNEHNWDKDMLVPAPRKGKGKGRGKSKKKVKEEAGQNFLRFSEEQWYEEQED